MSVSTDDAAKAFQEAGKILRDFGAAVQTFMEEFRPEFHAARQVMDSEEAQARRECGA